MISELTDCYFVNGDISSIIINDQILPNRTVDTKRLMYGQDITFLFEAYQEHFYSSTKTFGYPVSEFYVHTPGENQRRFTNKLNQADTAFGLMRDFYTMKFSYGSPNAIKNESLFTGNVKSVEIPYHAAEDSILQNISEYYDKQSKTLFELSDMTSREEDYQYDRPITLSSMENLYQDYRNLGKARIHELELNTQTEHQNLYLLSRRWYKENEQIVDDRETGFNSTISDRGNNYRSFCLPQSKYVWCIEANGYNDTTGVSRSFLYFVPIASLPITSSTIQSVCTDIESFLQSFTSPRVGSGGYEIRLLNTTQGIARLYYSTGNTRWWS